MGVLVAGILLVGIPMWLAFLLHAKTEHRTSVSKSTSDESTSRTHSSGTLLISPSSSQPMVTAAPAKQRRVSPSIRLTVQPLKSFRLFAIFPAPAATPVWEEKGWRRQGETYFGRFQVTQRSTGRIVTCPGRIVLHRQTPTVYVTNPPQELRSHAKWPCFSLVSGAEYRMHWHRSAPSVDDAILYVERILDESLNSRK